jgi:hypothetical protein
MDQVGGDNALPGDEYVWRHIECLDLTQELLARFERNDPDLVVGLTVQSNGWIEGAGIAFSQNKLLRRLQIVLN